LPLAILDSHVTFIVTQKCSQQATQEKNVEGIMSKCLKGESEVKKKDASFACEKCGAKTDKKAHICKPKKIKGKK
jgi:hypothetical protein